MVAFLRCLTLYANSAHLWVYASGLQGAGLEFFEAPAFTRYVSSYLTDDAYREMQGRLASAPEAGDMIRATGGFRKLRWADPKREKGQRGGLGVIYYYFRVSGKFGSSRSTARMKRRTLRPNKSRH
jgi:hypothetical protein